MYKNLSNLGIYTTEVNEELWLRVKNHEKFGYWNYAFKPSKETRSVFLTHIFISSEAVEFCETNYGTVIMKL